MEIVRAAGSTSYLNKKTKESTRVYYFVARPVEKVNESTLGVVWANRNMVRLLTMPDTEGLISYVVDDLISI